MSTLQTPAPSAEAVARLCNLPRFQPSVMRLLAISAEKDSAFQEFEVLFRSDPGLATEILQRANSAEFGVRNRISDIRNALVFLGLDRVRALAVTICMSLYVRNHARRYNPRPIWLHSMASAVAAEEVARAAGIQGFNAYTGALLHDLGRLGLLASSGDDYQPMLSRAYRDVEEANRLENLTFGMHHATAGSFLARSWNFPEPLCNCILNHHDTTLEADGGLVAMVQAACLLATEAGYPEITEEAPAPPGAAAAELLKLPLNRERIAEQIRRATSLF